MVHIKSIKLPSNEEVWRYIENRLSVYPYTIFSQKRLERIECKDITMFYGNNGSGKSTLLNLIGDRIGAQRNSPLFVDEARYGGVVSYPFRDFSSSISIQMGTDEDGRELAMPNLERLLTSDGVFQEIEDRVKHNQKVLSEENKARARQREILSKGYSFKSIADYDDLTAFIEAKRLSGARYARVHAGDKEMMKSNGETALDYFYSHFERGGIYLLDEPENCLSPVFQLELIDLIRGSIKYNDCQFFISTHSPLLLGMGDSVIYDLDANPVVAKNWEDLENVRIYFDFFQGRKDRFGK